jgi:hypothetical protein
LADRITYPTLANITTWRLAAGKKSFDLLFMMNEQYSVGASSFRDYLTVISPRDPVKIVHPNNTFTLNLTPCANQNHNYVLPVEVDGKQQILGDLRDFDYTTFDNTTLGYVHLFLQLSHRRPDEMIRIALKKLGELDGKPERVNQAIAKMNGEFNTGIPPVTEKTYRDSLTISGMLDSLVSKKLRQELVLTDVFIRTVPGVHPPNADEQYKMQLLFERYCPYYAFELFDTRKLRPTYNIDFNITKAVFEISTKILAQNPRSNLAYDEIWANFSQGRFTSESALEITISRVCMPPSVIGGSLTGIDFNTAVLLTDPTQTSHEFDYAQFPQMVNRSGNKGRKAGVGAVQYDTLLTRFSGLMVKEANLKVPAGTGFFMLKAQNVIVNNRLIAGLISVNAAQKIPGKVLVTQANGTDKAINIIEFLALLKKAGLNDVVTRVDGKLFNVYFKKIAGR